MSAESALWPRCSDSTTPGRDRNRVLERGADLDADHVFGAVDAERSSAELVLHGRHGIPVGRRGDQGRGKLACDFHRKARAGKDDDGMRALGLLDDDLGHPLERVGFKSLRRAHEDRLARNVRRRGAHDRPQPVRRHGNDHITGAGQRVRE